MLNTILWNVLNQTALSNKYTFLKELLIAEDYILYYYALEFSQEDLPITELSISAIMNSHKMHWATSKSLTDKIGMTREYLQSKSQNPLISTKDYADVIELLVVNKFRELTNEPILTSEELESAVKGIFAYLQTEFSKKAIENTFALLSGEKHYDYIQGQRFESTNTMDYLTSATQYYSNLLSGVDNYYTPKQEHLAQLLSVAEEVTTQSPIFKWNLGEANAKVLPDIVAGDLIAISGAPKVGKTRFIIGEMVYNSLIQGSNVCLYAGETPMSEVYTMLAVKHLFVTQKYALDFRKCRDIIILYSKIINNIAKPKDMEFYNTFDKITVELVVNALNEIINGENYGRLKLITPTDKANTNRFKMDNFCDDIMADLKSSTPDMKYDMVIIDHINLMKSGQTDIETFVKELNKLAKNPIKQIGIVMVNHLRTDDVNSLSKVTNYKDFDKMSFSTHNTREVEKSALLSITLVDTPLQKADGELTLKVNVCRGLNHFETFKTTIFPMVANRNTCTFTFTNCTKRPYTDYNRRGDTD